VNRIEVRNPVLVGRRTVIVSSADAPPLDAVTTATPGATPETSPEELTFTIDAGELVHAKAAFGTT
jgi:hypothetical protein